jgi:molecular chaperone GrpE
LQAAREGAAADSIVQGLELLERQINSFLDGIGAEVMVTEVGDVFDPEHHEAVMGQPATAEVPEDHVLAVLEPGVALAGRVVRPARVVVAHAVFDAEA